MTTPTCAGRVALIVAIVAALLAASAPPHAIAGSGLRVEGHTTWVVAKGDTAVRVAIEFTLTNLVPNVEQDDGSIRHTFFDTLRPGLPREATNVSADAEGVPLSVVTVTTDPPEGDGPPQLSALIALPERLFYRQTQRVTLRFDLPGSPPRSEGRVRVNPAYVAFDARAWGDPGLAAVEIRVDETFDVTTFGVEVEPQSDAGFTVYRATEIEDPLTWFVHVSARNDDALDVLAADVPDLAVTVLSWPGDVEWAVRVRELTEAGLPVLRTAIGLDYGPVESVDILQARDPSLLGFAGWYLSDLDRIEMGEVIDDHIVLHELTHIWFNNRLFSERWVNEGMAEVFAAHAVDALGLEASPDHDPHRPQPGDPVRVPLSEWVFPDVAPNQDERVRLRELYGYNASYWVMAEIAAEVGIDGLRAVIDAAARGEIAYTADRMVPEQAEDPRTDWRRLLDLLEERAGATVAAGRYRDHVVAEEHWALLDERAEARTAYAALAEAGPSTPWAVRRLMDAWDFAGARRAIAVAADIVALVGEIDGLASLIGVEAPASTPIAYEGASTVDDLEAARLLAAEQRDAAALVVEAQAAAAAPRGWLTRVGLIGVDVARTLAAARSAFATEDMALASTEATAVLDTLSAANDAGRLRAFWAGGAALLLLGVGVTRLVVSRRRAAHPDRA